MSTEAPKGSHGVSTPPEGVSPHTWNFLQDAVKTKAYESIDAERRNMIGIYFGSDASVRDLQKMFGYTSFSSVKYRILTGIDRLWAALPQELKDQHNPEVIAMMKLGMSKTTRKRMSEARQKRWDNDPLYRGRLEEAAQNRWDQYHVENPPVPKEPKPPREKKPKKPTLLIGSPEDRQRKSANAKALWADPVRSAKMREAAKNRAFSVSRSETMKALYQDPDWAAEIGRIHAELWADPEYRAKTTNAIRTAKQTPEERARQSGRMRAVWANPDHRKNYIGKMMQNWANPDYKARMLAIMYEGRTMPDRKAKIDAVARSLKGIEVSMDSLRTEEFMGRIKRAIRSLRLSSVNVQDAAAEIWISLAEQVEDGNISSDTELFHYIGNYVADAVNKAVVERYAETSLDRQLGQQNRPLSDVLGSDDYNPSRISNEQMGENMLTALENIEPFGRHILSEIIIEGRPSEEVAYELGISADELQDELNEALAVLRKTLLHTK